MEVRIRLFAGTRDAVGARELRLALSPGATAGDALDRLCLDHPRLARYRGVALLALDGAFVPPQAALHEGAELAIMPPVSGGAADAVADAVALVSGPLLLDPLVAALQREGTGAVVGFLGLVRATSAERPVADVVALRFEAHEEMALAQMRGLREEAMAKFALTGMTLRHRLGELPVGAPIVAVVAAAAHRRAAFEAAMWAMDALKTRVPIWKQEVDADGATAWINDPTR